MHINKNYVILEPFQLSWERVSPADLTGLEYHLSPDLSLMMHGIVTGDTELVISHTVLAVEGFEVNQMQAEDIFTNEYLPGKSQERINLAFKDGRSSCFFNTRQMDYLRELFEEKNFICHDIKVRYKGVDVDDIVMLPAPEFKQVLNAFRELNVQGTIDYKKSAEELEEDYSFYMKEKTGELERKTKRGIQDHFKKPGTKKKLLKVAGGIFAGVGSMVLKKKLIERGGVFGAVLAVLVATGGILIEMYTRYEADTIFTSNNGRMF